MAGSVHPVRHKSPLQLNQAWREENSSRSRKTQENPKPEKVTPLERITKGKKEGVRGFSVLRISQGKEGSKGGGRDEAKEKENTSKPGKEMCVALQKLFKTLSTGNLHHLM